MTVTDEMVEKAQKAYWTKPDWDTDIAMRAALEAVAPMLIAQGMYMAADMLTGDPHSFRERILGRAAAVASARELEQK